MNEILTKLAGSRIETERTRFPGLPYLKGESMQPMRRQYAAAILMTLAIAIPVQAAKFHRYSKRVPNAYIVVLADKNELVVKGKAEELSARFKGRLTWTYAEILGGFSVEMSEADAIALSESPDVAGVHEVITGKFIESPVSTTVVSTSWGLDRLDQRTRQLDGSYTYYYRGSDVAVYVLDSGVEIVGDLIGRVAQRVNFAGSNPDNVGDCYTPNGHGTMVASTIGGRVYGVAKDVRIVSVRTACTSSRPRVDNLIAGLRWVINEHTRAPGKLSVANISLSYDRYDPLDEAVRDAVAAGVVVVVGAGNDGGSACLDSPQRSGNPEFIPNNPNGYSAITVAASDQNDHVSDWGSGFSSNTGQCVDLFAPGGPGLVAQGSVSVSTTWQGTSAAAPHVSGIAALTLARFGSITPGMVENYILQNATSGVMTDNPSGATIRSGTPNKLLYQVTPPKRRACCS
jgi:subtilisin family serine protease